MAQNRKLFHGIHATPSLGSRQLEAPTESTHLSQHALPMDSQPPHSSALTVRRPSSSLTRSQQASGSISLLRSRRWSRQLHSARVGHCRSASEHEYQRQGARPAASTTPPTAVTKFGTILHFMYHNTSIHANPEIGHVQSPSCRNFKTPSACTRTPTNSVSHLSASSSAHLQHQMSIFENLKFL